MSYLYDTLFSGRASPTEHERAFQTTNDTFEVERKKFIIEFEIEVVLYTVVFFVKASPVDCIGAKMIALSAKY